MSLKELVFKNKETLLKDIVEKTGLTNITRLDLAEYKQKNYHGKEECLLTTNYLDSDLGIFGNKFIKVFASFKVIFKKEENEIFINGSIDYRHKDGGSNGFSILDKDTDNSLHLLYSINEEKILLKETPYAEGVIKVIIENEDIQNIIKIEVDEKEMYRTLQNVFKDMKESEFSIKNIKFFMIKEGVFVEYNPYQEIEDYVKQVVKKKKYSEI